MNGGLMKTTSRFAIAAAASVLATSAMAADLGGNCCADLEERVAELEATTARKGNRKVSLTISGQVHESIMFWDDGVESNTYVGVNHINSSSRFRFTGDAKISSDWSAGYLMEIETQAKSDSNDVNQRDQNNGSFTGVIVRHNAWWIDSKQLGRVWVGLTDAAGVGIDGINLSNSNIAANQKIGLTNSSFRLRGATDGYSARTWGNLMGGNNGLVNLSDETRQNVIKYVSPTMMGFIFSSSYGEDDFWDIALKYAAEFNGIRVAAGITYSETTDANPGNAFGSNHFTGCTDLGPGGATTPNRDRECSSWVIGGSMMHVPTGLFVAASYGERTDDLRKTLATFSGLTSTRAVDSTDVFWQVRGGVERNFFGPGKTTLFGEYNKYEGGSLVGGLFTATDAALAGAVGGIIVGTDVSVWGLGVVQTIDAAAMDLYLTYRNYSADLATTDGLGARTAAPTIKDFDVITFGGRIQF